MENSRNEIEKFLDQVYSERYKNPTYYNYKSSKIPFNRMTQSKRIKTEDKGIMDDTIG